MILPKKLQSFASNHNFLGNKGPLCVALVITDVAKEKGLPLDASQLLTGANGQVKGLGKSGVQKVLKRHDITRVLASEGGRTSRGSIGNMQDYVTFLNDLAKNSSVDLEKVEKWWVSQVQQFFSASPLKLKIDSSSSLRTCLRSVFSEAEKRQAQSPGATVVGAVMQHLVGAKLEVLYPEQDFKHNGYSVADAPTKRAGDFDFGDCAIHVTTSPSQSLMEKCQANLNQGLRPLIISSSAGAIFAEKLASGIGLEKRIDVLDIEQFLVANIFEWTRFDAKDRKTTLQDLITRYNVIVESCETDPSLKIELA